MTQISKRQKAARSIPRKVKIPVSPLEASCCQGPIDELLDVELFKGLGDPTRAKLLGCLAKCGRGCSVGEMVECCVVDFSVVSRHLALLHRAGIVRSVKKGRSVVYEVNYQDVAKKLRLLADAVENCGPGCCGADGCGGK